VKRFWEAVAVAGATLAMVRIVLLIARLVGVIGAFDQILIWAGFEESVLAFENSFDEALYFLISLTGL
jgi:hypothetical protein